MKRDSGRGGKRRHWYLPAAQLERVLVLLRDHKYATSRGREAEARAIAQELQRMGCPKLEGDEVGIELHLKPRIMVVGGRPPTSAPHAD